MIYVFTGCALNFLPAAKAMFRSVEQHLPDAKKILFIADQTPNDFDVQKEGADELMTMEDLRDEFPSLEAWMFTHNVMELATAIKPFVLERLLKRDDCEAVLFFDCDCVLYSKQKNIFDGFKKASILLTPHTCIPHLRKEWMPFEFRPLKTGTFNLGFFGVRNTEAGHSLAKWWKERLRHYCWIDFELGVFTDQKWMEYVPCYFDDYHVLRQSTLNVARWNTFQRKVTLTENGSPLIDDKPADFIHYSGFYKIGGYVKGLYDDESAPYCEDREAMDLLSSRYAHNIKEDAERDICQQPWAFDQYTSGEKIKQEHREYFRKNFAELSQQFPNPFYSHKSNNFIETYHDRAQHFSDKPANANKRAEIAESRLKAIYQSRSWKLANKLSQFANFFSRSKKR